MIPSPNQPDPEHDSDLWAFAKGDDQAAREALDRLWKHTRPMLLRSRAMRGLSQQDAEDLAQQTVTRILQSRRSFEPQGYAAWTKFVVKVALNSLIDESRKQRTQVPLSDTATVPDVPDGDIPVLETIMRAATRGELFQSADLYWLGSPPQTPQERLSRLAVQLVLEGMPPKDAVATLQAYAPHIASEIDDWLSDDARLRAISYLKLYWSNDRLTGYTICPRKPLTARELAVLMASAQAEHKDAPPEGWTWDEIFVVLLRFRNGLMNDQVERKSPLTADQIQLVIRRCLDAIPLAKDTARLHKGLDQLEKASVLRDEGLWRRLVFQYHVSDQLPHKQILERTVPAADVVGEKLTEARLNGWLSSGRLFAELAKFINSEAATC